MTDSHLVYVCPRGHINETPRAINHGDGSGEWLCQGCDHRFGVWANHGELDLGLIVPPLTENLFDGPWTDCIPGADVYVPDARVRVVLADLDLDLIDRCAARRQYCILRIAIYAPQSSEYARDGMYQGCYGMERDEAKRFIRDFYSEVSWRAYLGSK